MKHHSKITKENLIEAIHQCMSDIQYLVKNQTEISKEHAYILPDKSYNFRSAIYWVYHLGMNGGILKKIGLEIIYGGLDMNLWNETMLDFDVFYYYQQNKKKVS